MGILVISFTQGKNKIRKEITECKITLHSGKRRPYKGVKIKHFVGDYLR